MNKPCLVSVDETPGTPIPGWANISSTDSVTTFLALIIKYRKIKRNDLM